MIKRKQNRHVKKRTFRIRTSEFGRRHDVKDLLSFCPPFPAGMFFPLSFGYYAVRPARFLRFMRALEFNQGLRVCVQMPRGVFLLGRASFVALLNMYK